MAKETIKLTDLIPQVVNDVEALRATFGAFETHSSQQAELSKVQEVLTELVQRLDLDKPYFHPSYAAQMLKPPHAVAVAALPANAGMHVTAFVLLVAMNMLHQYLLPVSNLPNIIGLATEEITSRELIRVGAIMSLFGALFCTLMVYTYWSWIGLF